ncbi:post-transcriptional regulator [Alkalicoccus chagannorensis]|uniref:post-transcriptional regulator n=1 Tax=Alkalicoccus chagannorensis TaxID=427072 RepID=UPI0004076823|nr:post-transcriptional regulator [Alkalicoccus chagannorensis]
MEQKWEEWRRKLDPILKSKQEEWVQLGYEKVSKEDVWKTFIYKLEKQKDLPELRLHWMASQLFRLSVNDYMNRELISAYKQEDWFSSKGSFSLRDL